MQLMGRWAMKASRSFAAFAPHRYCKLSSPRQSWLLSGASIPHNLIRVPWISSVSPSMMLAWPVRSSAAPAGAEISTRAPTIAHRYFRSRLDTGIPYGSRSGPLLVPIEIWSDVGTLGTASLTGEALLYVRQPDVIRPPVTAAPSLLPGLLFGARFHILGYLYAGEEIEIARRA